MSSPRDILLCQCFDLSNLNISPFQCPSLSMFFLFNIFSSQCIFLLNILPSHWVLLSMFSLLNSLFSISFLLMSFPLDVFPSQCLPLSIFSLLNVLPCQVSPSQTPISPLLKIILSQSSFLSLSSSHSVFPS